MIPQRKDRSIVDMKIAAALTLAFAVMLCSFNARGSDKEKLPPLRKQIAQMLMVGFNGTGPDLNKEMKRCVQDEEIGSVIIYETNVLNPGHPKNIVSKKQLTQLVSNLKKATKTNLLVAVDEEGGNVSRLKEKYGYPPTVKAQYIGDVDNPDTTLFYAKGIANSLAETGINMNYAPCIDVNINPKSPVIGARGRSFSSDPYKVITYAETFYDEQIKRGIASCYKHFPGHGSATTDSHEGFTDITSTWNDDELIPYKELIKAGKCDVVMTAHVYNSNFDKDYPATLSKNIITGILRNKLGFNGVVVSDDMLMDAISVKWDVKTSVRLAIDAGVDMLCFANQLVYDPEISTKIIDMIEQMVKDGSIKKERITESYLRIQALKKKLLEK